MINSPTMMMRSYFSSHHLWAAQSFAAQSAEIEKGPGEIPRFDIAQRAFVTGSILSAAAFLEAAINELCQDVADGDDSYVGPLDEDSKKLIKAFWDLTEERNRSPFSILDKCQIVLTFCRREQFSAGAQPYQDADLAIRLRNELMHYKPETLGGDAQHKFLKRLPSKFAENPLIVGSGNPYFPDKCLGSPCAAWGRALATYAAEHPRRADNQAERPFWKQIHAALHGWMSNYDEQKRRFVFDPQSFGIIANGGPPPNAPPRPPQVGKPALAQPKRKKNPRP